VLEVQGGADANTGSGSGSGSGSKSPPQQQHRSGTPVFAASARGDHSARLNPLRLALPGARASSARPGRSRSPSFALSSAQLSARSTTGPKSARARVHRTAASAASAASQATAATVASTSLAVSASGPQLRPSAFSEESEPAATLPPAEAVDTEPVLAPAAVETASLQPPAIEFPASQPDGDAVASAVASDG